jgi:hypothetical protein
MDMSREDQYVKLRIAGLSGAALLLRT